MPSQEEIVCLKMKCEAYKDNWTSRTSIEQAINHEYALIHEMCLTLNMHASIR